MYKYIITMDIDMSYPETLIIVITAHGRIEIDTTVDGRKEPDIFGIPLDMTLTRINAVAPGICNYLSSKIAKKIVERTKEMVDMYDLGNKSIIPSNLVKYLSTEFKRLSNIDKDFLNATDNNEDDEETAYINTYNTHYNKAYTNSTHKPYTFALNKIYSIESLSPNYMDKILLLNAPQGEVDYFTTLQPPYETDLKSLVLNLAQFGVKNILLIDLSCSVFDDKGLTARWERAVRREARGEGWWGGRKKSIKVKSIKVKSIKVKSIKVKSKKVKSKKVKSKKVKSKK